MQTAECLDMLRGRAAVDWEESSAGVLHTPESHVYDLYGWKAFKSLSIISSLISQKPVRNLKIFIYMIQIVMVSHIVI